VPAPSHPSPPWGPGPLASGSVPHPTGLTVPCGVPRLALTVPRAPSPRCGVTSPRGVFATTWTGLPQPSSLLRAPAPDLRPLAASARGLGPPVLAGCRLPLLGRGPSRWALPHRCGGAWTRTPPRFCSAPARFFPPHVGLTSPATRSAPWHSRHSRHCSAEPMSGLQSFRPVQAPPLARPPGCSSRRSSKSSGQPGRVRHAMPMW